MKNIKFKPINFLLISSFLLLNYCMNNSVGITKEEARDSAGKWDESSDICEKSGWYNDGECDDFCLTPDPDCIINKLSTLGDAIYDAARDTPEQNSNIPADSILSFKNRAEGPLVEGPEIFPTLGDLIADAQYEVNIAMYVWEIPSQPNDSIIDGIKRLHESQKNNSNRSNPVVIRIIINSVNLVAGGMDSIKNLWEDIIKLNLDPEVVEVNIATKDSWGFGALHHKIAIIDGKIVLIGGANVESCHNYDNPWHDSAYVLYGQIAQSMLFDYDVIWSQGTLWRCAYDPYNEIQCESSEINESPLHNDFVTSPDLTSVGINDDTYIPMIAITRAGKGVVNNYTDNPQDQGYLAAISNAKKLIKVETPNINDDAFKNAIIEALGRGVEVRIISSLGFNELGESLIGQGGSNFDNVTSLYNEAISLLGEQQAEQLLQIKWYSQDGINPVEGNVEGASHAKYMSIDGQVVIVGTANMDTQSWNHSGEVNVAIDSSEVTQRFDSILFDVDWEKAVNYF